MEVWNLVNELELSSQTSREKSENRADAALYSAGLDLLIAMEALTVKLASSSSFLAAARKTIFTIPEALAERLLGPLSEYLVKEYSARLFSQIGAGLLFTGISIYDAWHSYRWGDDAYIGQLVMASGGLMAVLGGVVVGGTTFLGLTPLGWASLLLIVAGAGLGYWLSSKPIEDWLNKGPFG
ncbi:hypothetical protein IV02_30600, partial [Pseudomonas syringae]